jgi:hypothetical protein
MQLTIRPDGSIELPAPIIQACSQEMVRFRSSMWDSGRPYIWRLMSAALHFALYPDTYNFDEPSVCVTLLPSLIGQIGTVLEAVVLHDVTQRGQGQPLVPARMGHTGRKALPRSTSRFPSIHFWI